MEEQIIGCKDTLVYGIARPEDVVEVTKFASEHFFNSSPIRELSSFDDPADEAGQFSWMQGRLQKCFARPTSIIIREKITGNLVAYQAMMLEDQGNKEPLNNEAGKEDLLKDRSSGWLLRAFYEKLSRDVDLFSRYGTDRILSFVSASVRSDYRERKVLSYDRVAYRSLMEKIIHDNGPIGALKGYAFNRYVAPNDWETIRSIDFKDFELSDGTKPLAAVDLGVHRTARFIAKRMPPSLEKQENTKTCMTSRL